MLLLLDQHCHLSLPAPNSNFLPLRVFSFPLPFLGFGSGIFRSWPCRRRLPLLDPRHRLFSRLPVSDPPSINPRCLRESVRISGFNQAYMGAVSWPNQLPCKNAALLGGVFNPLKLLPLKFLPQLPNLQVEGRPRLGLMGLGVLGD